MATTINRDLRAIVTVQFRDDEVATLKRMAQEMDVSVAWLIRRAVRLQYPELPTSAAGAAVAA